MAEYIERGKALKAINEYYHDPKVDITINNIPSADVVEVVRCSECQHWGGVTFGFVCRKFSGENMKICMHADGYCSYGERRSI